MTRRVIVRAEAKRDIREARAWYRQRSPRAAEGFVARVRATIALIRDRPFAFEVVRHTWRRVPLHRFPYSLYYDVSETRIAIVAVLHQARDPETVEERWS